MSKFISGALLLVCFFCFCAGMAEAVSLPAGEDLVLRIPLEELLLSAKATKAPQLRLERRGQFYSLQVTKFVAGTHGEVQCRLPHGLKAGHYAL